MTQHAGLTVDRWSQFPRDHQVLMIANEMNRASRLTGEHDTRSQRLAYERVLRLVDLSVEVADRSAFRRELLRWRDLVAALYLEERANPDAHRSALKAILLMTPTSAKQVAYLVR